MKAYKITLGIVLVLIALTNLIKGEFIFGGASLVVGIAVLVMSILERGHR